MRNHKSIICIAFTISVAPVASQAQFNIDIEAGSGVPSAGFGAAANQPGFWNATTWSLGPERLRDLHGRPGPEMYSSFDPRGTSGIDRNVEANTGNYAALLNDGLDTSEYRLITLSKLRAGTYDVYIYNVATWAPWTTWTEVTINQALSQPVRVMQSPTIGNQFVEGRTHTIHRVRLRQHEPLEILIRPTIFTYGAMVSGIQIVPVKE